MSSELSCVGAVWLTLSTLAALGASSGFFLPYWLKGTYTPPPQPPPLPSQPNLHPLNPTPVFFNSWRRCNYLRVVSRDGNNHNNINEDTVGGMENVNSYYDVNDNDGGGDSEGGVKISGGGRDGGNSRDKAGVVAVEMVRECGRYTRFQDIPSLWWQAGTVICGAGSALALLVVMAALWALCVRFVLTKGTARLAAILQFFAAVLIGGGVALYPLGWGSPEVRQVCGASASVFRLGDCELYWAFYLTASSAGLTLLCSMFAICAPSSKVEYS